ncbi:hypothetical protein J23TS9_06110 [Paenibacillus sp. J23TS9]|uniref:hypothetical protein n=1 Tax=Paenibacillus sp. J23TS9 TaxID=2807193 RepID=UPI001B11D906|nr:hypothetical protein [Paenibacillus sp. J23TS9]GIP25481.1 hypothetical protein J23TS9_06110 [Paenibacillus sp. J23TS9]
MKIVSLQENDTKAKVIATYTNETLITHVDVSKLPEPESKLGKVAELCINTTTNELFYEYIDVPLTESEKLLKVRLDQAEAETELMKKALEELILSGGGL